MNMAPTAYAYLVRACVRTSSGALFQEPDTICFDLDLALAMAEMDRLHAAGLAVYAIDADGAPLAERPVVSHGIPLPPDLAAGWACRGRA
ncbi:hypothetical protein J5J86_09105 [Aquabacter sp. L1I39]|uniref:hypothetical protein n=1 Tax=Aquabacter sp. L1I39 TaxID=2820278 RepID=UPI001ADAE915|nr:hypothetical protein [Aquabacter sp. L1I39]QTL05420.1 hypothetical protein J5J86_09105 [Aquabacter sp. L1I39]